MTAAHHISPTRLLVRILDFVGVQRAGGLLMALAALTALWLANSFLAPHYFHFWEQELTIRLAAWSVSGSLHFWVNDFLMAAFFFVVGLEIKRQVLVGELRRPAEAALPLIAAVGGMVVPAAIYAGVNSGLPSASGWGVPMATDIAFSLSVMALLGRRVPKSLFIFLAALAIADDIGAILVIALFYSDAVSLPWLAVSAGLFACLLIGNLCRVRPIGFYVSLGLVLWWTVLCSGIHATLTGVLVALVVPARPSLRKDLFEELVKFLMKEFEAEDKPGADVLENPDQEQTLEKLVDAAEAAESPLERLEHQLSSRVTLVLLPVFALANAGLVIEGDLLTALADPAGLGAFLGLVIGKSAGVFGFAWGSVRLGLTGLPPGVSWLQLYGVSWLTGIGFTVSLFIVDITFSPGGPAAEAKLSVMLASLTAAAVGWLILHYAGQRPADGRSG